MTIPPTVSICRGLSRDAEALADGPGNDADDRGDYGECGGTEWPGDGYDGDGHNSRRGQGPRADLVLLQVDCDDVQGDGGDQPSYRRAEPPCLQLARSL